MKAKEINWTDVDFVTTSASYYTVVAEQPNGVMNGLYCLNSVVFPYYDTANEIEKNGGINLNLFMQQILILEPSMDIFLQI